MMEGKVLICLGFYYPYTPYSPESDLGFLQLLGPTLYLLMAVSELPSEG